MPKHYKPSGYNSVSPYFVIKEVQRMVDLLKELFDATVKRRYDMPDGTIMHIEVQVDDSIIMMGEASEEFPANNHLLHVYVKKAEEIYIKAISLGCEPIEPPKQKEGDPDKRGTFKDFAGNIWSVGTQIEGNNI
jgi:uncharacterized glyoxalase superfamily protein PhnB